MRAKPDQQALARAAEGLSSRIGFRFDLEQPAGLWAALVARAKAVGAPDPARYVAERLVDDREWARLGEEVAVHETSFFRHAGQFRALEGTILPELVKARHAEKRLVVWSAACATGEEAYSLAILIHRLGLGPGWRVKVHATDLSTRALARALEALYDPFRLRGLPRGYLDAYFTPVGARYRVRPEIASLVELAPLNLVTGAFPAAVRGADLVLCENVLIYFRDEVSRDVMQKLRETLRPGGYLLLGYAETLWGMTDGLAPLLMEDTYVYRRLAPGAVAAPPVARPAPATRPPAGSPPISASPPVAASPLVAASLASPVKARPPAARAPAARPPAARAPVAPPVAAADPARSSPRAAIERLIAAEDLAAALARAAEWSAREPDDREARFLVARLGAALGRHAPAADAVREVIAREPLYAPAYLLLGLLCDRMGEAAEALAQLHQALYVDPALPLAWFHAGNLYQRAGDARRAVHAYRQALKHAPRFTPEWDSGLTRELLVKLCEQGVARLAPGVRSGSS